MYKFKIPFRTIDNDWDHFLPKELPNMALIHRHIRVPVQKNNGQIEWLVVDPTMGQWFGGEGVPNKNGDFVKGSNEFFIGSYDELVSAFAKNLDKLSYRPQQMISKVAEKVQGPKLSYHEIAEHLVNLLYNQKNAIGEYQSQEPLDSYKQKQSDNIQAELNRFYGK